MDTISKAKRSRIMARIGAKNTAPELVVRSLLHKEGYRFRLHRGDLPGTPDIVFPSRKAAIFVHGCFWHQHGVAGCPSSHVPRSNKKYWVEKLKANVQRDRRQLAELRRMGWNIAIVWECEIHRPQQILRKLNAFLRRHSAQ